jgi:hypothetical protein
MTENEMQKFDMSNMNPDQKARLVNRYDNFFEALYLSPHIFERKILNFMTEREKSLKSVRNFGQVVGSVAMFIFYLRRNVNSFRRIYFKNVCIAVLLSGFSGFALGRFSEYTFNVMKYKEKLYQMAWYLNISDEEISNLQFQMNENMLKLKQTEPVTSKGTLDKIKFKM